MLLFIEVARFDSLLLWIAVLRIRICWVRCVLAVAKSLTLVRSLDQRDVPWWLQGSTCRGVHSSETVLALV